MALAAGAGQLRRSDARLRVARRAGIVNAVAVHAGGRDIVAAAFNDAVHRLETTTQERMSGLMGGRNLPAGHTLPFGG